MQKKLSEYLASSRDIIRKIEEEESSIQKAVAICVDALKMGNKIIFCGNGGSAAEAQHFAAEFTGKFLRDRPPMASIALTVDTSAISAIGNDYGFEFVFSRQLNAIGKSGDVLIGMSTSGKSKNIIHAFKCAKEMNIKSIALIGEFTLEFENCADVIISVASSHTNFIQEAHLVIGHYLCGVVEEEICEAI